MGPELCWSNKLRSRVSSFVGCLFIFPAFFASSRRRLSSLPPFFPTAIKREQQGEGMHRSAVLPAAPTAAPRQQGLRVRMCPPLQANRGMQCPWWGERGKPGKTASPVCGGWPNQGGRRAGCSCPHCSFGQRNWGQGVQFTTRQPFGVASKVFVSLPFISFPCPNNHPLSTLRVLAVFLLEVGGIWMGLTQDAQISASQMPRSADDTPWPWFSCTTLGSMSNFFSFFFPICHTG